MWPFGRGRNYAEGARILNRKQRTDLLTRAFDPIKEISYVDRKRLVLKDPNLALLVYKYHDSTLEYGFNYSPNDGQGDSNPDCDEFELDARHAVVVKANMAEGLLFPPAFGKLIYERHRGGVHAANWGLIIKGNDYHAVMYEPQNGSWMYNWEDEVKRVILVSE